MAAVFCFFIFSILLPTDAQLSLYPKNNKQINSTTPPPCQEREKSWRGGNVCTPPRSVCHAEARSLPRRGTPRTLENGRQAPGRRISPWQQTQTESRPTTSAMGTRTYRAAGWKPWKAAERKTSADEGESPPPSSA